MLALAIQAAAVVVALGASIVALVIASSDRRAARAVAARERKATLLHQRLDAALRLLENRNRGGSLDPLESQRMGAEALTLVAYLGPDLVPRQWARQVEFTDDELRARLAESEDEEFLKDSYEALLAVSAIVRELRALSVSDTSARSRDIEASATSG